MELVGAISAREWSSQNGIYGSEGADHDSHFMVAHENVLADHSAFPSYHQLAVGASGLEFPFPIFSTCEGSTSYSSSAIFANSCSSQYNHEQPVPLVKHNSAPLVPCDEDGVVLRNADLFLNVEGGHHHQCLNQGMASNDNCGGNNQPAVLHNTTLADEFGEENGGRSRNYMKRSRSTPIIPADYGQDPKNKRNVRSRKSLKPAMSDNEVDDNAKGPISPNSSYSAGEHSNASQEELGGILSSSSPKGSPAMNLNGKTRAARGSAPNPQSVYARKRREKINEKLKILQHLVPNGTKVDISTMLEDAVQYVKFLQLQIKLLSSDDLWMYAPLAYNGMDIGLDLRIAAPRH
ncbi:hypothetical protein TIFTF001_007166 [Ficus carica]|uniref:BHLH domain-containing protein n=1 Tax=Ficus carica TaxID=3494 RepID=A0AA87ZQK5_FICCA|nr:hypothetical protein TIFTF001_007166 [Ficus carica]